MDGFSDIIYYGSDARGRLIKGINKVADAVKCTLGPGGKNVILGDPSGMPVITKDGVSVAKYIKLIDPIENMGAQLMKQASGKTVTDAGDGTTTSTVLAQTLINSLSDSRVFHNNVTQLGKGIEAAKDTVLKYLETYKIDCNDVNALNKVALTSANGDAEIAKIVSDVVFAVGKNGVVNVEMSELDDTRFDVELGYKMSSGYPNSKFINKAENGTCLLKNAFVITISDKVDAFKPLIPLIRHSVENKNPLVIIAKEFTADVIENCAQNFKMGNPVIPIKAPEFGENMIFTLEDIAIYCDSDVMTFAQIKSGESGTIGLVDKVSVSKYHTILNSSNNASAVVTRSKQIKNLMEECENSFDRKKLETRLAMLSAGLGTIKVGGNTPAEIKEKFDRYEDAVGAVQAAFKYGILPGGGTALFHANMDLPTIDTTEDTSADYNLGYNACLESLTSPYEQILNNAGIEPKEVIMNNCGVDAATGEQVNMMEEGIIDPFKVTTSALKNAVSIAIMILSTGCVLESNMINVEQ